jgi:hypothetical protein
MFEWTQTRTLAVTPTAMYNVHNKKVKRCIMIKDIDGISKITNTRGKNEFAVHVNKAYDYRFETDKRDHIIDLIKRCWFNINHENIPIYGIPAPHKDLREFTTTEKDMKKNRSKHPTPDYRILSEDVIEVTSGQ